MKRAYNVWSPETYEWVMSLKGKMSSRAAERETGISHNTIRLWWRGGRPMCLRPKSKPQKARTHCLRGHALTPKNIQVRKDGKRRCLKCERHNQLTWYYRNRARRFHPIYNPDPELAPLEFLWFRSSALLDELLETATYTDLYAAVGDSDKRKLVDMKNGRRRFVSYESADRICLTALGFPASALKLQPVYGRDRATLAEAA